MDVGRDVPDPVTFFAAAAWATREIGLGLAVVPTYPRHPAVLANQAQALSQLAGSRVRLGVGPSHAHIVRGAYGLPFERPLAHLREYLTVLRALLGSGTCRFHGEFCRVDLELDAPAPLPLCLSALRPRAMRLAGELADGAIAWLAPVESLRDEALPHLAAGAETAAWPPTRLVASWPCVVTRRTPRSPGRPSCPSCRSPGASPSTRRC